MVLKLMFGRYIKKHFRLLIIIVASYCGYLCVLLGKWQSAAVLSTAMEALIGQTGQGQGGGVQLQYQAESLGCVTSLRQFEDCSRQYGGMWVPR
ncbi:hypothetical protein MP228_006827 [Amoeboaphelidium protococcarum]|nr:hypothetical protein MP228_006827 [Amoeboaphelidium protococcarum]